MITLYFQPVPGGAAVMLRADQPVNAWQGEIILPAAAVRGLINQGITDIWQTAPQIAGGGVIFAGGATSGFTGEGELFRILLNSPAALSFGSSTTVYLADGQGTLAELTLQNLNVAAVTPTNFADNIPPEPFTIELYRSPELFGGKEVALFSTEDKQSGIARYEVREKTTAGSGAWHLADSPYLVQPDVVGLEVRAVDNAGNMRLESIRIQPLIPLWVYWLLALVLVSFAIFYARFRYNKRKG